MFLTESLLALRIQLLSVSVGESERLSGEWVELGFFLLERVFESSSQAASSECVAARWVVSAVVREVGAVSSDEQVAECIATDVEERVPRRTLLLLLVVKWVPDVALDLTPFSSRCRGQGF